MKKALVIAAALILSACATNTGIVQLTEDTYMYGKQDYLAWSGSNVKADMYKEAIAFCKTKGKTFEPAGSTASDYNPYQQIAGAEIQFKCK